MEMEMEMEMEVEAEAGAKEAARLPKSIYHCLCAFSVPVQNKKAARLSASDGVGVSRDGAGAGVPPLSAETPHLCARHSAAC